MRFLFFNRKLIAIGISAVIAIAVLIAWSMRPRLRPPVAVTTVSLVNPVTRNAPTLNGADIEKLLGVERFRIIRQVNQVPAVVKESFSNFTGQPFDLVDPPKEIQHDYVVPERSRRRLVFLGLSDDSAVIVYEEGGYVDECKTVVFWFGNGGLDWGATLQRGPIPEDISNLRAAVHSGKFHVWEGMQ